MDINYPLHITSFTDASDVEASGRTERGTEIVIIDKEIPVSNLGLFLEMFQLRSDTGSVIIKASDHNDTKEIVRNFVIKK